MKFNKKTAKNVFYGGLTSIVMASCGSVKDVPFKQVNKYTSDTYSQLYVQVTDFKEKVETQGDTLRDNDGNKISMYQIEAINLKEFSPKGKNDEVKDPKKTKPQEGLDFSQRKATDSMNVVYTIKKVEATGKDNNGNELKPYLLIEGTDVYNHDYLEVYKIFLDGDKLSTKAKDWLVQTNDIKGGENTPFIQYNKLSDDMKRSVDNRLGDYIYDIFFPNRSPADGIKVLIGEGNSKTTKNKPQTNYRNNNSTNSSDDGFNLRGN